MHEIDQEFTKLVKNKRHEINQESTKRVQESKNPIREKQELTK